jgi:pimeloyl-ACP methyl ester carboxylesterase
MPKLPGGAVAYESQGEGPAVLFLHAFPLHRGMWDDEARALLPTHQVIRFDARGFGDSPPDDGLLSMERIADDAAAVLDVLAVGQAVVCGLSMGGYAAFAMCRRHPDRLRALVIADARSGADSDEARQARGLLAAKVREHGAVAAAEALLPKLLGETTRRTRPDLVEKVRQLILAAPPQGIVNALAGLAARADSTPSLREIRVPTLIVCGGEDAIAPQAEYRSMHEAIPGSRLEVLPQAGHLANLEDPAGFERALASLLSSLA